jgi:hypothetical protein
MFFNPGDIAISRRSEDCRYGHTQFVLEQCFTADPPPGTRFLVLSTGLVPDWVKAVDPNAVDYLVLAGKPADCMWCAGCFDREEPPKVEPIREREPIIREREPVEAF